jgi:dipeptidyl aminopeptidase/acylaminoacyl peptidase
MFHEEPHLEIVDVSTAHLRSSLTEKRRCRPVTTTKALRRGFRLGLFSRDQDDLVFSLWSGGSSYRVRVWQVSDAGVRKVAELPSRGRPDFLTDDAGRSAIRTYEADSGVEPFKPTLWSFVKGRFVVAP